MTTPTEPIETPEEFMLRLSADLEGEPLTWRNVAAHLRERDSLIAAQARAEALREAVALCQSISDDHRKDAPSDGAWTGALLCAARIWTIAGGKSDGK